jgi:hypothetical protein
MKLNKFLLLITMLAAMSCFAQETKWTRIEFEKSVSISVPGSFLVSLDNNFAKEKFRITSQNSKFLFTLSVFSFDSTKVLVDNFRMTSNDSERLEVDKIVVRRLIYNPSVTTMSRLVILIGTNNYYYNLELKIPNSGFDLVSTVSRSIEINGKPVFSKNVDSVKPENIINAADLKTSDEIKIAESRKLLLSEEYKKVFSIDEIKKSNALTVKYSRLPFFLETQSSSEDFQSEIFAKKDFGKVIVRVLLKGNGEFGAINVYSTSDEKTVKKIVKLIQRTRFVPAQINAENVDYFHIWEFDLDFSRSGKIIN